jgi:hypothetical protein
MIRWTLYASTTSQFSICESFLKGETRTLPIFGEIENIVYFDSQTPDKVDDILGFGPCPIELIISNLSGVYADPRSKFLAAQMQCSPQFFNSEAERHPEVKHTSNLLSLECK